MTARLTLPPEPASVPRAREAVRDVFARADPGVDEDTALLLVSELVTNAVLHARTEVSLAITSHSGVLRVEVGDSSPASPYIRQYSVWSATGRGLRLLQRLAVRWGIEQDTGSGEGLAKVVWFELGEGGLSSVHSRAEGRASYRGSGA